MNKELERQRFREGLFQALASEGHARSKCKDLTSRFDQLTDGGMTGEGAAGIIYAAYGANDAKNVCRTIKDWVESELENFTATHAGIDTNPATRLKKTIKTFNENIDKCCILINAQPLSAKEIQSIKAVVPSCLQQPKIYTATASDKSRVKNFTIEVTI